ncbi:hypothetical protein HN51_000226 [Arachis hypogaea]
MKFFSLLILFFASLLICSSTRMATGTKLLSGTCNPEKPPIIRIWFCKNEVCQKRCKIEHPTQTEQPRCVGRDTCVCCYHPYS